MWIFIYFILKIEHVFSPVISGTLLKCCDNNWNSGTYFLPWLFDASILRIKLLCDW